MFARERKEELLAYMRVHKRAGIHELSEEFHVTGATIRSDLSELEKEGHLIRHRWGRTAKGRRSHKGGISCLQVELKSR